MGFRELSKKQKRRKTRLAALRALSKDPKKEKLRMAYMKKQIESPEMKAFVEQTKKSLGESLKEILLPDGVLEPEALSRKRKHAIRLVDKKVNPTDTLLQLQMWTSHLDDKAKSTQQLHELNKSSTIIPSSSSIELVANSVQMSNLQEPSVVPVTPLEANRALTQFVEAGEVDDAEETLLLMHHAGIAPQPITFTHAMSMLSKAGEHDKAVALFNSMVGLGIEPDTWAWTALVHAQASSGDAKKAIATVDRVKQFGLASTPMYTTVLKSLVDQRQHQEAYSLWERMHLESNVPLTLEAFTVMLKLCAQTREVERAFFYMDEMRCTGVKPDTMAFTALFRACAGAPHWVNGYQNTIFDAMAIMEGAELVPTTEIYNAIIYAFGKAGDCAAAEFYFWEMRSKGILQTVVTYNALLDAYAKSNSIGARHYGNRGRYVRPPDRPKTAEEEQFQRLGSSKTTKVMSQGLWQDVQLERGKRQVSQLEDLADNVDDEEELMAQLGYMARRQANDNISRHSSDATQLESSIGGPLSDLSSIGEEDANDEAAIARLMDSLDSDDKVTIEELLSQLADEESADSKSDDGKPQIGDELDVSRGLLTSERRVGRQGRRRPVDLKRPASSSSSSLTGLLDVINRAQLEEEANIKRLEETPFESDDADENYEQDDVSDLSERDASMEGDEETNRGNVDPWVEASTSVFSDPFLHLRPVKKTETQQPSTSNEAASLLALLDGTSSQSSLATSTQSMTAPLDPQRETDSSDLASISALASIFDVDEDEAWSLVEFGRAPDPDYSSPLPVRQSRHIRRAELSFDMMRSQGVRPDRTTLTSLLSVYAEALKDKRALQVMESFASHGLVPDMHAHRALIRMYIRKKDMSSAMQVYDEMHASGLKGDGEVYGMLIESFAHRDALPEALKILERASDMQPNPVKIPERHLRVLRARCDKLGVRHPDMPADPTAWVKLVKSVKGRSASGTNSSRKVQQLKSWN